MTRSYASLHFLKEISKNMFWRTRYDHNFTVKCDRVCYFLKWFMKSYILQKAVYLPIIYRQLTTKNFFFIKKFEEKTGCTKFVFQKQHLFA